jgi:hypothetical protein
MVGGPPVRLLGHLVVRRLGSDALLGCVFVFLHRASSVVSRQGRTPVITLSSGPPAGVIDIWSAIGDRPPAASRQRTSPIHHAARHHPATAEGQNEQQDHDGSPDEHHGDWVLFRR